MNNVKAETVARIELNKQLDGLILLLANDENFEVTFYSQEGQGYVFNFPQYESVAIAARFLVHDILKTKKASDCQMLGKKGSWSQMFYAAYKPYSTESYFHEGDGVKIEKMYRIAWLCCLKLNLTLCEDLDQDEIKKQEEREERMYQEKRLIRKKKEYEEIVGRDMELIKLFSSEFDIPDFMVLDSFLWLMGNNNYEPKTVIKMVRDIWESLPESHLKTMNMYLPLISKYVRNKMED